ncbi:hypothetical protein [Blastococcus sp. Marseille-P5729]|uniref:hypothetical protein n=1 Tax=Blastococcus sp. Marseille-P5729 TaxID=2086582 RepID=UPI000D1138A1|nr:hypothetical protein [Blastococcus sp. Marseille-P5729]
MADAAPIRAPHLQPNVRVGPPTCWTIAAPGRRLVTPASPILGGIGGLMLGSIVATFIGSEDGNVSLVTVAVCIVVGVGYAKLLNRLLGNGRLIARGVAVRIRECERNRAVVSAAARQAPAYFDAAVRASEVDRIEDELEGRLGSAERAVRSEELAEGVEELRLVLSQASLTHAAALLDPSDPAIRAAGRMTAAMYAELYEGQAAAYDEDS